MNAAGAGSTHRSRGTGGKWRDNVWDFWRMDGMEVPAVELGNPRPIM
jgi:hypothetical protein